MEKRLKKILREERGITLVALIITVILMLILAGVAISAVIGGEGLFGKTREATKTYENSAKDENKTISNLMNYIERYMSEIPEEVIPVPQDVTLVSSNISTKTFTLTAGAKDKESILSRYEIYINDELVESIETYEETIEYNATVEYKNYDYNCKVRVYNEAGGYTDKEIKVKTNFSVEVGDFVNYDAGIWDIDTDTSKLTSSGGSVNWSVAPGTTQGEFCGFVDEQSRNTNAISEEDDTYKPIYNGWRIWEIDENGIITLISARISRSVLSC